MSVLVKTVGSASRVVFSEDERYRYALSRIWDPEKPPMLFVGLNPSTADEKVLDPTLRRVSAFAEREGCGGMWIGNLFALRATKPRDMLLDADPVGGPENDMWLLDMARWCGLHVVGWGSHGDHQGRDQQVARLLAGFDLRALKLTKAGQPGHPLYLRKDQALQPWGLAVNGS